MNGNNQEEQKKPTLWFRAQKFIKPYFKKGTGWVKAHKKEILIGTATAIGIIGAYVRAKSRQVEVIGKLSRDTAEGLAKHVKYTGELAGATQELMQISREQARKTTELAIITQKSLEKLKHDQGNLMKIMMHPELQEFAKKKFGLHNIRATKKP